MRLINADKLRPDRLSKEGQLCISQSQVASAVTVQLSPCDLCIYNPPSSMDNKPCSMCPAIKREEKS